MSFTPIYRRPDLDALLRHQQRQEFDELFQPRPRLISHEQVERDLDIVLAMDRLARPAPPRLTWWQRLIGRLFRRDRAEAGFEQDQSWASDAEDGR